MSSGSLSFEIQLGLSGVQQAKIEEDDESSVSSNLVELPEKVLFRAETFTLLSNPFWKEKLTF